VTRDETSACCVHELVRERVAVWMDAHPDDQDGRTDAEVWKAFGVRYGRLFNEINASGRPGAQDVAAEMGRRGISYLVRAKAFEDLGSFASGVVTGTRDPRLLRGVVAELVGVVEEVPAGKTRWSVRTYVADALRNASQSDIALAFYEAAAKEAEASEHWPDVGRICQNWAEALRDVGQLDAAKATLLQSAEALNKAGSPRVNVLGTELRMFHIDVMQGNAASVLPEVESRLAEVRSWWRRYRDGEDAARAPDPEILRRVLVYVLDIAWMACQALGRWEDVLELLEEKEEAQRTMGRGEQELARTRFNRYGSLLQLERLDEAQRTLEGCLAVYRKFDDTTGETNTLSALADLWIRRGDLVQALGLERQALAGRNRLPDLAGRSMSHANLSSFLRESGEPEESANHLLAAIVYGMVMNHRVGLARYRRDFGNRIRRDDENGGRYELPRLADILGRPEFSALKDVVDRVDEDVDALQTVVDELVEGVRGAVDS
jgi:tetratricopeptide (TPR) repeat protein